MNSKYGPFHLGLGCKYPIRMLCFDIETPNAFPVAKQQLSFLEDS